MKACWLAFTFDASLSVNSTVPLFLHSLDNVRDLLCLSQLHNYQIQMHTGQT